MVTTVPDLTAPLVARRRPKPDASTPAPTATPVRGDTITARASEQNRVPLPPQVAITVPARKASTAAPTTPERHPFATPTSTVEDPHSVAPGRVTPPERFDPSGAWAFSDLASACPLDGLDAANRLDPYWGVQWGQGSGASWLSVDLAHRQTEAGFGHLPAELATPAPEAIERVLAPRGFTDRLALLGALFSWRTLSAQQAAALVGDQHLASALSVSPASLFSAGLLDLGVYSNGLRSDRLTDPNAVPFFRSGRGSAFDDHIKDRLTWAEWVSVTGGQKFTGAANYDRHDLLGAELALRLAEYTEVGTVLGERFSTVDLIVGTGLGRAPILDQRAGDLTVVRPDGMRVLVEITANAGTHFLNKVRRWAQIMTENPLETSGLSVVFVVVQHPGRLSEAEGSKIRARTYQAIAAACKEFPGSVRDRVAERMGVATWREWFPASGQVHDAFFTMRVDRPTGRGADLWEPADMLDPTDGQTVAGTHGRPFTARDPQAMTAILDNAALLGQTPRWLAERQSPPPLWPLLLEQADSDGVPVPTPVRANRTKGRPLGAGVGSAGDAKPPRRLLGLNR